MTIIRPINPLPGLRTTLSAAPTHQATLYKQHVMEPLRPFWEPFLNRMPPIEGIDDPIIAAAKRFNYYTPDNDSAAGLAALERLQAAETWERCIAALEQSITALDLAAHKVELPEVALTFVLGDPAQLREDAGWYTGYGSQPGIVFVMAWPTEYNLPRIPTAVAHEFNHNVRFLVEPMAFDCPLGQYVVAEGLAESFGVEICGQATLSPCATALTLEQLEQVKPRFAENLHLRGFDQIRGYIFGDWAAETFGYQAQHIPNYAGYTIGYELVQAYLQRTGKTAAAATYDPWETIIVESGYFA